MNVFRLRPKFSKLLIYSPRFVRFQSNSSGAAVADENDMAHMRESIATESFINPTVNPDLSPKLRQKLSEEFEKFLQEFVHEVDPSLRSAEYLAKKVGGIDIQAFGQMYNSQMDLNDDGNMKGRGRFSSVNYSEYDKHYTIPEMYIRKLFHARRISSLGADVKDVYRPYEDLNKPKPVHEAGINTLIAAGAHLGHSTQRIRANCLPYVYGVKDGIHIIDLQITLASLRRISRVAEELGRKGGIILFVGTREGQQRTVERAAYRCRGYYVGDRWIPGTLTNYQVMIEQKQQVKRLEIDMADNPTGRELSPSLYDTIVKPDLVVVLNPIENRALLSECIRMRIPTTGVVDTDSEPSLMTYAIPGNDDSLRFTDLVAGVISVAARRGRETRLKEFHQLQQAKEKLKKGLAFNSSASVNNSSPEKIADDFTNSEREMLKENL